MKMMTTAATAGAAAAASSVKWKAGFYSMQHKSGTHALEIEVDMSGHSAGALNGG